jgi:hypothetical protein
MQMNQRVLTRAAAAIFVLLAGATVTGVLYARHTELARTAEQLEQLVGRFKVA